MKPTMEEHNNCAHFSATAVETERYPHYPSFSAQEDSFLTIGGFLRERSREFRVQFVAGVHSDP